MLDTPVFIDNPSGGGIGSAAAGEVSELQNGGESDRNAGGNRWPHDQTLALLQIRSEMDFAFRDSTPKAPLWEQVSRKLEELGYQRSAKKCKEKFENIYKYHKRTKECRSGGQKGKNYRFFDQLEILGNLQLGKINNTDSKESTELGSPTPVAMVRPNTSIVQDFRMPCISQTAHNLGSADVISASTSATYSSGKESGGSVSRKMKMAGFFEKLMKEVLEKQEDLQKKFLEVLERCERDRMVREESWKREEMERMRREQECLAQERAIAEAKDAALIAFLQKIAGHPLPPVQFHMNSTSPSVEKHPELNLNDNNNERKDNCSGERSSRWPKAEIEALIKLRTNLDLQYLGNGSKAPLWEEIAADMKKLGYDRNAKKCKEKWENINKYYRRVKEGHKRRPGDSKTCPYFHILDSLYQSSKSKKGVVEPSSTTSDPCDFNMKAGEMLMHIINQNQKQYLKKEDIGRANDYQNHEEGESEDGFRIAPAHEQERSER
ncbi:hypothetical protein DM860_016018 [Cuscuta australis]|uniref:Myb-like domain-containing protein n=1 Tax=Cuscuta australis TaxID=267555 RepID=A0A328DJB0_9ASTE|nr:hypothetical protein DM860_016018 [Cuscuta australis]